MNPRTVNEERELDRGPSVRSPRRIEEENELQLEVLDQGHVDPQRCRSLPDEI
jgi:hypothetical protein